MEPLDLFKNAIGKQIKVHLSDKTIYTGELVAFDIHVNIMLKNTTVCNFEGEEQKMDECMVNGQSVTYIENV